MAEIPPLRLRRLAIRRALTCCLAVGLAAGCGWWPDSARAEPVARAMKPVTLEEYRRQVVFYNESVQLKLLELEVNRRKLAAARAAFEPALVLSGEHLDSQRPNTVEQRRNLGGIADFDERNNLYSAGLEWLAPTGTTLGFRYMLRDLTNNLQGNEALLFQSPDSGELVTFIGIELTQPLLKDRGTTATLAAIRLAAGESELAYQDYRREMMVILSSAEIAYWNLRFAQEQSEYWGESLRVAEKIRSDQQASLEAGRGSELDVMMAKAAAAERSAKKAEAWQKLVEASNAAASFFSASAADGFLLVATDQPAHPTARFTHAASRAVAVSSNPDFLSQAIRMKMDDVRVDYARNQSLPRLDLKASAGFNGLGDTITSSWADVRATDYPVWSVGLELRIPLGNRLGANQLAAARLRRQQTVMGVNQIAIQIDNAIDNAIEKLQAAEEATRSYRVAVEVNQGILDTEMERLGVGKSDSRKVLEAEENLFESKVTLLRTQVQLVRSFLEVELFEGSILARRDLDLSQDEIQQQTATILRKNRWNDRQYQRFLDDFRATLAPSAPPSPAP